MFTFLFNKKVVVKRYSDTLGEYNRPIHTLTTIGTYDCFVTESSSSTSQLQPQKKDNVSGTLYTEPNVDIQKGDILYVYQINEYGELLTDHFDKYIAEKPYKKRTKLITTLLEETEV